MEVTAHTDDRILRITRIIDPPGLRLEGELDATQHGDVRAALSSVSAQSSEVRLDLARLSFIDLGSLRLLTSFAGGGGREVRLVLDNLSPDVENLIETVGWHRLPGLVQGRKGRS